MPGCTPLLSSQPNLSSQPTCSPPKPPSVPDRQIAIGGSETLRKPPRTPTLAIFAIKGNPPFQIWTFFHSPPHFPRSPSLHPPLVAVRSAPPPPLGLLQRRHLAVATWRHPSGQRRRPAQPDEATSPLGLPSTARPCRPMGSPSWAVPSPTVVPRCLA